MAKRTDDVHVQRRAIVAKEKHPLAYSLNQPMRSIFCTFSITILPVALTRVEVWIFTIAHVILFLLKESGHSLLGSGTDQSWGLPLTFSAVAVSSGMLSLLLVFFNSQCYTRYMTLYAACTAMTGDVQELAQLTSVHLTHKHADARWDACRFLMSSVMIVYMRVTDLAANRPPSVDDEDWKRLMQSEDEWLGLTSPARPHEAVKMPPLLSAEEVAVLRHCSGKESQVLQMWALHATWAGYVQVGAQAHFKEIEDIVLDCRRNSAAIPNILDMPVPFPYYHMLCALMYVNYTLYAVTFLGIDSWLTPLALFLICATTTGVRELSSALANPFGDDEVDFNASRYMHKLRSLITFLAHPINADTWWRPSNALLADERIGHVPTHYLPSAAAPPPSAALEIHWPQHRRPPPPPPSGASYSSPNGTCPEQVTASCEYSHYRNPRGGGEATAQALAADARTHGHTAPDALPHPAAANGAAFAGARQAGLSRGYASQPPQPPAPVPTAGHAEHPASYVNEQHEPPHYAPAAQWSYYGDAQRPAPKVEDAQTLRQPCAQSEASLAEEEVEYAAVLPMPAARASSGMRNVRSGADFGAPARAHVQPRPAAGPEAEAAAKPAEPVALVGLPTDSPPPPLPPPPPPPAEAAWHSTTATQVPLPPVKAKATTTATAAATAARMKTIPLPSYMPAADAGDGKVRWRKAA